MGLDHSRMALSVGNRNRWWIVWDSFMENVSFFGQCVWNDRPLCMTFATSSYSVSWLGSLDFFRQDITVLSEIQYIHRICIIFDIRLFQHLPRRRAKCGVYRASNLSTPPSRRQYKCQLSRYKNRYSQQWGLIYADIGVSIVRTKQKIERQDRSCE